MILEHGPSRQRQEQESNQMLRPETFAHIDLSEEDEDGQRDNLLERLQLIRGESAISKAIRRHLQAVFEEGQTPADQYHQPEGPIHEAKVAVPRERHEDIREKEERDHYEDGHVVYLTDCGVIPSRSPVEF